MKREILFTVLLVLFASVALAQEDVPEEKEESLKGTHQLTFILGHSHIGQGIKENGQPGWKAVPSFGLDYSFWLSKHWALGLHNDLIIESFEVEDDGQDVIERSTPLASVATVIFKPGKHVSYLAGMGGEFAKEGSFALTRVGIESGWEMKSNWEFSISFLYDVKWNAYDTWVFGLGISKLLRKNRK